MRWCPGLLLPSTLALAALLPACSKSTSDPLAGVTRTVPPPSDADVAFTANNWSSDNTAGREIFAARLDGSAVTQLTFCNKVQPCDMIEAAFSPERARVAVRQRLAADQPASLQYYDLTRSASAELVPSGVAVSGIDWSPTGDILAYSGSGPTAGSEDLYRTDVARPTIDNQQGTANLTCITDPTTPCDPTILERRPRLDTESTSAVFERIGASGKGEIYVFVSTVQQALVVPGAAGTDSLPGTGYVVGGNADPDYSPDAATVVFRRLRDVGSNGLGTWDLLAAKRDGTDVRTLVTGPAYRGARTGCAGDRVRGVGPVHESVQPDRRAARRLRATHGADSPGRFHSLLSALAEVGQASRQSAAASAAPPRSLATSQTDESRPATNDWWNSSLTP